MISSLIAVVFRVLQLPERCIFKSALKTIIESDGGNWKQYKTIMRNYKEKETINSTQKRKLLKLSDYANEAMEEDHCCYYYFTSHQFWHIFVNLSVFFQIFAWILYFEYRQSLIDPCC